MISASQSFIDAIESDGRTFRAKILKDGAEVDCDIISFTANKGVMDSDMFVVGSVFSSTLQIVVANQATSLENEDITLQIGVMTDADNDTFEYITYGTYTVIKVQKDAYRSTITAIGSIAAKLNVLLPTTSATPTIESIATSIANTTGVSVNFVGVTAGLTNTLPEALSGMTCRTALSIIAFLIGGYAIENANGGIEIRRFVTGSSALSIPPSRCLTPPLRTEGTFELTGVKVIVSEETEGEEGEVIPEVSYQSGDPIRQVYSNKYMTQTMFSVFAENVVGFQFAPATIDYSLGDPRLEASDWVTVTDVDNVTTYSVPCFLITDTFDGGFQSLIQAFGESEVDQAVEGDTTRQIGELTGQLASTQMSANLAKAAAASAQENAGIAKSAADAAQASATIANNNALSAINDADNARKAANNANKYANGALNQLSVFQDVIGVLQWASEHGSFVLTQDTDVKEGKVYFVYDSDEEDYVPIIDPQKSDLSTYYELSVDEAMQSFIMAHLAVTQRGLWVLPSGINTGAVTLMEGETEQDARARTGNNYKMLLANNGTYLYDGDGVLVTTYGESIRFSSTRAQYIGNENAFIIFDPQGNNGRGSLQIGGSSITIGSSLLNDVVAKAETTFIYDHDYTINSTTKIATFTAHLYNGGVDVKESYDPKRFTWFYKTEDALAEQALNTNTDPSTGNRVNWGYTITIDTQNLGYGGHVIGCFETPTYISSELYPAEDLYPAEIY